MGKNSGILNGKDVLVYLADVSGIPVAYFSNDSKLFGMRIMLPPSSIDYGDTSRSNVNPFGITGDIVTAMKLEGVFVTQDSFEGMQCVWVVSSGRR